MRTAEEFWARVDRSGDVCHNWLGGRNNSGYGTVNWSGKIVTAHRLAAFLLGVVDTIERPADWLSAGHILHQCDNPRCCNPAHWKLGTMGDNQREAYARGLKKPFKGETHANAKLTNAQAAEIRQRWPGTRQVDLAAEYGVSQVAISLIVRGKTYATQ